MDKIEMTAEELKSLVVEATQEAVKEQVEGKIKELGLDQVEEKLVNKFSGSDSIEAIKSLEGKEKSAKFFRALYAKDTSVLGAFKAMSEGTGSAGGFVVPEEFTAEVFRIIEDYGLVAKMATRIPMGSDTRNVPRLSSSVTVSYPGENTAGTASQPVMAQVQLLAKTCVGLTAMSNELLADANVNVVELLAQLFAEAIAGTLDTQGLAGTGSPFTGILGNASVNVVTLGTGDTSFADVDLNDLRDLVTQVKPWALQGAGYIMHREVWAVVQKLRTTSSVAGDYFSASTNPVIVGVPQGFPTATAGFLWGYPVYLSDQMPDITNDDAVSTKFVIFGNLKHLFYGVREELAVSISDSATVGSDNLFEQNMSAVRVVARHALSVGLPTAFAVLKTAAS